MPRSIDPETDRRAELAAYLAGELKLSHKEVAGRMSISASNVSRLLSRAARLGCYVERVVRDFVPQGVTPHRLEQLRTPSEAQRLVEALASIRTDTGVGVRSVRVFPGGARHTGGGAFDEQHLVEFGRWAAPHVAGLIGHCDVVAVTWGTTISRIIDGIELQATPHVERARTIVVPVCAEVEDFAGKPQSSSVLASRLQEVMSGGGGERPMLTRIPAFIPRRFLDTERERGVREMIGASPSYCRIFGGAGRKGRRSADGGGLVARASMLLTSVGSAEHPVGLNYNELLDAGDITPKKLKQLVVGDIGGILIHRLGKGTTADEVLQLNRMWTGLQFDALKSLAVTAQMAAPPPFKPGVVVACCGRNRAEILEAVVRRGLVNELILDDDAAIALHERLTGA